MLVMILEMIRNPDLSQILGIAYGVSCDCLCIILLLKNFYSDNGANVQTVNANRRATLLIKYGWSGKPLLLKLVASKQT